MDMLLPEDRIEACKMFFTEFGRVPKANEKMNYKGIDFKIGKFVYNVKKGFYTEEVRHEVNCIFNIKPRIPIQCKIEACKDYFNKFNKIPSNSDVVMLEDGKMFKIGKFIQEIKCGRYKKSRNEVQSIFGTELESKSKMFVPNDKKIEACMKFFNKFGRVPKVNETMMVKLESDDEITFKIGEFVHRVINGLYGNQEVVQEVNNVFNGLSRMYERKTDEEVFDLIKEYKIHGTKSCNMNIPSLIHDIKQGDSHKLIKDELIKFLNTFRSDKEEQNLELIKRYFTIHKHMPPRNTVFEGVKIRNLIDSIIHKNCHKSIKQEVEQLVQRFSYY